MAWVLGRGGGVGGALCAYAARGGVYPGLKPPTKPGWFALSLAGAGRPASASASKLCTRSSRLALVEGPGLGRGGGCGGVGGESVLLCDFCAWVEVYGCQVRRGAIRS